jgi:sugar lactone lactonase YvrE
MPHQVDLVLDAKAGAAETPVWDAQNKLLYWTDLTKKRLHIYEPANDSDRFIDVGSKIGTVVIRQSGGVVVALESGFNYIDLSTGDISNLADPEPEMTNNRFNDGKCDSAGRLWVSSVSQDFENGKATMVPYGKLYRFGPNQEIMVALDKVIQVNGLGWSVDNKKMYLVDTVGFAILSFDFDEINGVISNQQIAVQVPESFGYPDGMCLDDEGSIWLAHWGGYQVSRWNPVTGNLIETIAVPASQVTCCSFGGDNLDELYITTARHCLSEEELAKYPYSGGIFKYKPGVTGPVAHQFAS